MRPEPSVLASLYRIARLIFRLGTRQSTLDTRNSYEKLETTAIYAEVNIGQLQEVHARCHPAAKLPEHAPHSSIESRS